MEQTFVVAIFAGLGGMFGWGLADFFAKKTINVIGDISSLVWGHIFGTLIFFLFFIFEIVFLNKNLILPNTFLQWLLIISLGMLQAIIYLLVYRGFAKGPLALLNPVFASFSGLTALLSITIFHEVIPMLLLPGLILVFFGVLLINIDFQSLKNLNIKFTFIPGMKEILWATILAAVWTLSWDKLVNGKDWISFSLIMYTMMTLFILSYALIKKIQIFNIKSEVWKFVILIGLCETIAYLSISLGYSSTSHTSIIAIISGSFSVPTILLARLFLKEQINRIQTIGSIIVITGIIIVSLL